MNTITSQHLLGQLNWRYATKQFDPQRKISPADWTALEDALVLSPSSFGLQPWKFVVVTHPALRYNAVHRIVHCCIQRDRRPDGHGDRVIDLPVVDHMTGQSFNSHNAAAG